MIYKTLIFDLDGTLIHSAPDLAAALNHALVAVGRAQVDLPTVISFIGNGVEKLVERGLHATGAYSDEVFTETLEYFMTYYEHNMTVLTRPYPGVVTALEALKSSGAVLGICTNKPTAPARAICDDLNLTRFFDVICGAEPNIAKKPDAAPLLGCVAQMEGRPDQTLYIGDSSIDYHTAQNANITFRLFTQGYLNETLPSLPEANRFSDWAHHGIEGL
ncbi:HAD-IA family hydrolase [Litoreibacter sp.]|nr:HAD-IA family hydrolase [Litoreibacter sp.]